MPANQLFTSPMLTDSFRKTASDHQCRGKCNYVTGHCNNERAFKVRGKNKKLSHSLCEEQLGSAHCIINDSANATVSEKLSNDQERNLKMIELHTNKNHALPLLNHRRLPWKILCQRPCPN